MFRLRLVTLAAGAAFAGFGLLGLGAGPAGAQPLANVVAAIKNQTRLIHASPGERTLLRLSFASAAESRSAVPSLNKLHATMLYAAADVSHATVQSPVQRVAKRAWVQGIRDQAGAVAQLETAAREVAAGHRQEIKPHLALALRLILVGARKAAKGDALLDLAHNGKSPTLHLSGS